MPGPYSNEQIIIALRQSGGLITRAAKLVPCDAQTIRDRIHDQPDLYKPLIQELREELVDDAEAGLAMHIRSDGPQALQAQTFALRTLGRDRGYGDRTETVLKGDPANPLFTRNTITIIRHGPADNEDSKERS